MEIFNTRLNSQLKTNNNKIILIYFIKKIYNLKIIQYIHFTNRMVRQAHNLNQNSN